MNSVDLGGGTNLANDLEVDGSPIGLGHKGRFQVDKLKTVRRGALHSLLVAKVWRSTTLPNLTGMKRRIVVDEDKEARDRWRANEAC